MSSTTAEKIALGERLIAAGVRHFEATSFVSLRAVPQLADAAEVIAALRRPDPTGYGPPALAALVALTGARIVTTSAS
mgnify:CR=1 FL=1